MELTNKSSRIGPMLEMRVFDWHIERQISPVFPY
jgi:hypothetical protein